ncbi:unnamed protein product [Adineta steineri]|uniref:Uncharacterized protein n=1 Tax=Adineta steineri TaxID=433720 RepID=A0A818M695_9BILA|nr:unnamed protein product [Adineta steineri]
MTDNKDVNNTETNANSASGDGIDELVNIVNNHLNPVSSTPSTVNTTSGSARTHSPPLMGTSARAAKRRVDNDITPVRIEGTDTYNQQLQHHYQNVRQILEDQQKQAQPTPTIEAAPETRHSFSSKRDYFEQRFKTPPPTYDAPPSRPQQQPQKIITTITTTTTSSAPSSSIAHDRTSSSSNESPSVDRVLEQAVELQKMSNINSTKHDSITPLIVERTEEYQVFLNAVNHEVRRTPSIARTTIVSPTKTGHATDLDQAQAQAQVEHTTDDHQAIQNLTRALQEHNVTTINEYKRLPSSNPSSPTALPSTVFFDRTNLPVISNEFSVIDALLNNPIGTNDAQYNSLLSIRYNDIMTNLRNPEYLNSLKQPPKPTKQSKKQPKEKKVKEKKVKEKKPKEKKSKTTTPSTTDTVEHAAITPLIHTSEQLQSQITEQPLTTNATTTTTTTTTDTTTTPVASSEQTPLIDPKEKKKKDKENKKQIKTKSKQKSKNGDYEVLDAIIGSPVSIHLPDSYLVKYNVSAPLSQSSPSQPIPSSIPSVTTTVAPAPALVTTTITSKNENIPVPEKNQTLHHLVKIVHELQLHNASALLASLNTTSSSSSSSKANTIRETKEPVIATKATVPVINEAVLQKPSLEQQKRPISQQTQPELRPQTEVVKPRIIYRYIDEYGRVLKISSTPPSQLREQPSQQQYSYRNTEPAYLHGRYIAVDDERRHPLQSYEQRATWQGEPKLPTTVTREDFELRDKRIPQLSEQSMPTSRTVPVSVDQDHSSKSTSSQYQHRPYHYPNQQNVKLAWLPLSYQNEPPYAPTGGIGYDTDSTISERSARYRPYDYAPNEGSYHYAHRPSHSDYYYHRPSGPSYYPPPPPLPYGGRGISPEYGGAPRNYIEVFRGGDFRETKPSEVYSLPLNEHIRTSPISSANNRHSRYDQYQSERYGSMSHRHHNNNNNNMPSSQYSYNSNTLPHSRYQNNIPSSTVHTSSSYYSHRSPYQHRTVQSSPNPDYPNYVRQSKSFDYRPLRTKLQREYKITPNLLVDEWDYPQTTEKTKYSTTTVSNTNRSGVSSPDDVFISNRTNEA